MGFLADSESAHYESPAPSARDISVTVGGLSLSTEQREQLGVMVVDTADRTIGDVQTEARGTLHQVDLRSMEHRLPALDVSEKSADVSGQIRLPTDRLENGTDRLAYDVGQEIEGVLKELYGTREVFQQQLESMITNDRLRNPAEFMKMITRVVTFFNADRIIGFARKEETETISPGEAQGLITEVVTRAMDSGGEYLAGILTRNQLWLTEEERAA